MAPNPPPNLSGVTTQRVFPNLTFSQPLGLFQAPGDASRIFIQERPGRIRVFPNMQSALPASVTTFLDIQARVDTAGEGGFLGVAFHPQWATRREVFVSYSEGGGCLSTKPAGDACDPRGNRRGSRRGRHPA